MINLVFFLQAAALFSLFLAIAWLARAHVRWIAHRLDLPPDPILGPVTLLLFTLLFWPAALMLLPVHGITQEQDIIPLLMQAGLLACAVTDAEREWLPDSYTLPLLLLALYGSPLPGFVIMPIMVMTSGIVVLAGLVVLCRPALSLLLPGRGDFMLWLALTAWGGMAGSLILLAALLAGGLTLMLTGRDHTPLGSWMGLAGAWLVPVTAEVQHLTHGLFILWSR